MLKAAFSSTESFCGRMKGQGSLARKESCHLLVWVVGQNQNFGAGRSSTGDFV